MKVVIALGLFALLGACATTDDVEPNFNGLAKSMASSKDLATCLGGGVQPAVGEKGFLVEVRGQKYEVIDISGKDPVYHSEARAYGRDRDDGPQLATCASSDTDQPFLLDTSLAR